MKRICALLLIAIAACSGSHGATGTGDVDGGTPPLCGNGVIDPGEQCDDGNTVSGDGCSSTCTTEGSARCGDGILDAGEQCDDGNTVSGDGCSSTCQIEGTGVPCTPDSFRCGSGGDVEVCNNAGTAWLFEQSCTSGCAGGVCTDPTCTPGATRCHGAAVETCDVDGMTWSQTQVCTTFCAEGQCALATLSVGSNSDYDGTVIVAGNVDIGNDSTLTASSGDLTIIADNITVEAGAAIAVAPTSTQTAGASCDQYYSYEYYYYGANYGEAPAGDMEGPVGGENESAVQGGGIGGATNVVGCQAGTNPITTHGGGTIHLIATHDITIAGQLLAPGQPAQNDDLSGGAGGGIELAGDTIEITGSISTTAGTGGSEPAGYGRVRVLYGTTLASTGTIIGTVTQGRRPPIDVTSPTQPDPALIYNDDFTTLTVSHERPFAAAQGYLHSVDANQYTLPTPATGVFAASETFDVGASLLAAGQNYIHVISVDASSALGSVETTFPVDINTSAPTASSTSHPSATTWYANANPYFAWTLPGADASFTRVHYVFDHYGDTVPTLADTALPVAQKQLLVSNVDDGIWVLHVVSEDTVGHLTKAAAHVVVRVGTDPGTGTVFGSVFDENNQPVVGATIRVNRGLFTTTTATGGSYSLAGVSAGTWEISVVDADHHVDPQTLTVTSGGSSSANFSLIHN